MLTQHCSIQNKTKTLFYFMFYVGCLDICLVSFYAQDELMTSSRARSGEADQHLELETCESSGFQLQQELERPLSEKSLNAWEPWRRLAPVHVLTRRSSLTRWKGMVVRLQVRCRKRIVVCVHGVVCFVTFVMCIIARVQGQVENALSPRHVLVDNVVLGSWELGG
jgi:hypothetical protein